MGWVDMEKRLAFELDVPLILLTVKGRSSATG